MLVRFAAVAVAMMYSPVISGAQDPEIPPVICSECPEGEEGGSCRREVGPTHTRITRTYRPRETNPDDPMQPARYVTYTCRERFQSIAEVCRDNTGNILSSYPYFIIGEEVCTRG
jgi:hypothetical protein